MGEFVTLVSVEELFETLQKMEVGDVLDIAGNITNSTEVYSDIFKGGEEWYGISRIDLSMFDDEGAFVIDVYGGGGARIISYRDDKDDMEYAYYDLKDELADLGVLQKDGRVAVECKLEPNIKKVRVT